ncbi:xaa-Pro aminopeptidase ApepP [Teleopsis dalmanni]|uniref:xaa-Pro aminopeptidase ApepP n=1 Tax=Teleopsis dalmanni TaxID=139649 RepID=UPI0018CDB4EE|nr:xaa-Pro aminopeptidase ApepP [Teleopsis dalmanni]
MKDTTDILFKLREILRGSVLPHVKLSAYIVPSDDAHQSEYICEHDQRRAFVSGFTGSAGTAVITLDQALLWTDGRYYQQAEKELDGNWILMRDGLPNTKPIGPWLAANLPRGSTVGVDPKLMSYRSWCPIDKALKTEGSHLISVKENLIDIIWSTDQPERTSNEVVPLGISYAGETILDKWKKIKQEMINKKTKILVVSALDEIAWFLNLRGSDIEYNPVFFAYLIITNEKLILFIEVSKLSKNFHSHLKENNVEIDIEPYEAIGEHLERLNSTVNDKLWISPTSSYYLTELITKFKRHQEVTPLAINKAVKNATEVKGFIDCHIRDGIALCQYFAWLEQKVCKGEHVDEISGAKKLEDIRSNKENYVGLSFSTISAFGKNGSVIHYHPAEETNLPITDKEIYLCDSGAQYKDGTTDVTRTFHFGKPTEFQKETYTRVLKGQLSFGATIFPAKVKGQVLDTIARKSLWDVGLDYGHGTGHGVGYYLNVHEGPIGVGIRIMPDDPGLQENMFISNEPGYYHEGEFGIRIEDIVQIVPGASKYNFGNRGALSFKTITMCPKQLNLIKKELLTDTEIKILNAYHLNVWETLSPILKNEGDLLTLSWLKKETQPI